ncbi:MAG TPA: anti-sigma factor [Actinomycetota bacterium]|nr:anti-sigma factor [Actinomycetota bacterium]
MTRDHALIDELLAIRVLDALDDDDRALLERELAAHGDCGECRRLEAEHSEVAGMLALALDPRPVNEGMADRILARADRDRPSADEVSARRDGRLRRWQAGFGVAAAIALILAFALATRQGGVRVPETFVPFEGASGTLAMAYTLGERGVLVWGTGLPDPGAESVYELWMIEDGEPVRGACLVPTDGAVAAYVDADPSSAELMAVTVESSDCPDSPTTDPIYTAELA